MTTVLIAADQESSRGWGGPIALLVAVVLFLVVIGVQEHLRPAGGRAPSPTDEGDPDDGVTAQVSEVSDTDDTDRDTSPWGWIVNRGGRRVRVYTEPGRDDELDLDLDAAAEQEAETLEDVVDRMEEDGVAYAEIVRRLMADHRVSESTAKRAIRRSREARAKQRAS
ncbi:hypothetical protein ACFO0M_10210 [Micromonospora mangrovi]|uniref:Uncharacterized protein n=2 Tax=Micromonospora TaxID=1873 RepID=A0AAU8HBU6_9ACTN